MSGNYDTSSSHLQSPKQAHENAPDSLLLGDSRAGRRGNQKESKHIITKALHS